MQLDTILKAAMELGASDIHLVSGHPPMTRIHTVMTTMDYPVITPESATRMLEQMATDDQMARFEKVKDADFSYQVPGVARFRVNAHRQRQTVGVALRLIKETIPPFEDLSLPEVVSRLTYLPRGLVLVTGDTGSGKSTTLAAMIDAMNKRYQKHIITLEDPTEYAFVSNKCLIEQRELGDDTPSFASGLRHVLRQDPDIILVGEMRDLETTAAAITAAETGHLVLSTLHTVNASHTVERIIDMYPADQQNQIRSMLANTLQAVVTDMRPVKSAWVDLVWSRHNLEHLYYHEVPLALKEFCRVLKPGGAAIISLPNLQLVAKHLAQGKLEEPLYGSPAGAISAIDMLYGHRDSIRKGNHFMSHKTGFTAQTLAQKLMQAGFRQAQMQLQGFQIKATAVK